MNEYYVYALIDPRDKSIFYIGKGKGKRYLDHEKNLKQEKNLDKAQLIKEILESGNNPAYKIIAENLDEESAFLLEKILVFRLGRKVFNEGILSNLTPGGSRTKDASYFLNESEIPSDLFLEKNFPHLVETLKSYPAQSKPFAGIPNFENPLNKPIYVYDYTGQKIIPFNINDFILLYGFEDLIKQLAKTTIPIYAFSRIWSKYNYDKLPDYSFLKIADISDIGKIDLRGKPIDFGEEFRELLFDMQYFDEIILESKVLDCVRTNDSISYSENYINGNRKIELNIKDGKLNGVKKYFYDNGILKYDIEYSNGKRNGKFNLYTETGEIIKSENYRDGRKQGQYLHRRFYANGNIQSEIKSSNNSFYSGIHKEWYNNNILKEEIDYDKGVANKIVKSYNKKGELSKTKWYIDYKLKKEIDSSKGHKNRIVKSYNKKGVISKTQVWVDGKKQMNND